MFGFISTISANLFSNFSMRIGSKLLVMPIQIATMVLVITAQLTCTAGFITFIAWFYNTLHSLINYIDSFMVVQSGVINGASESVLGIGYQVLQSIGVIDALVDVSQTFLGLFASILMLYTCKLAYTTAKRFNDEFFKISLLITQ